jgi:antitoxin PrlF
MSENLDNKCCSNDLDKNISDWNVESILNIDDKGQLVIPKDVRVKANFNAGDKIALISCKNEIDICCLLLVKSDKLIGTISDIIRR